MDDKRSVRGKCLECDQPLDESWQCPERSCRAAYCPHCGESEHEHCEHLMYTDGEWVYYAAGGQSSESQAIPHFDFFDAPFDTITEALEGDEELAEELLDGGDSLRIVCGLVKKRIGTPTIDSNAGSWHPGGDAWSNTWVQDGEVGRLMITEMLEKVRRAVAILEDLEKDDE